MPTETKDGDARCQRCGVALTGQAVGELCANCLLRLALDPPEIGTLFPGDEPPELPATPGPRPPASGIRVRYFGDYELVEEIARGGMGVVYKARQVSLNRTVALKMILAGDFSSPALIERFQIEARAAARLEHPHIVPIHEIGVHEGLHYFSMRFVDGGTLTHAMAGRKFTARRAAELMIPVARAVHHAHQRGILHRDLKPGNILLDRQGEPHVADFGLAKLLEHDQTLTQGATVLGTPAYMAPEQAEGQTKEATTAVDVYSLGAILYELLTGRPPFVGASALEVLLQVREREPVSPRSLQPRLDRDLAVICLKCLEKNPARRYGSAEALAEELQRWLAGEPLQARRTTLAERAWKWTRRKPVMASLSASILLVGLAGFIGVRWQSNRAKVEAGRATAEAQRANMEAENARQESRRAEAGALAARRVAYAADMNFAQQALAAGNLGHAEELLNRYRPETKSDTDLRGWEWRYLWRQCKSDALLTLCQRTNPISSLTASFDGKWIAFGEVGTNILSVWDLKLRKEIAQLPGTHSDHFKFSPRESILAIAGITTNQQGCVWLWDPTTRRPTGELPLDGFCRGLAFSANGQSLMTITDTTLCLWQVPEKRKLSAYAGLGGRTLAVSPDLKMAAYAASKAGTIFMVDLPAGTERWTASAGDDWSVSLSFSPDSKILASGTGLGGADIRLLETASGKEIGRLSGHRSWVTAFAFGSDGKTLVSASGDQTIRVWDLETKRSLSVLHGHKREVRALALPPESRILLSGSADGSVQAWDTEAIQNERACITLPTKFDNWHFAPDSKSIFIVGMSQRILRSKGTGFQEMETWMDNSAIWQSSLRSLLISPDGRLLAVVSTNNNIQVWDLERRALIREIGGPPRSRLVAFLADGKQLAILNEGDDTFHELDLTTGDKTRSWPVVAPFATKPFSSDGGWYLDTAGLANRAGYVVLSPDGKWNLTLGYLGMAAMTDIVHGHRFESRLDVSGISGIAFSPDSRFFAAASGYGFARLWETASLREVATYRGFLLGAHSVAFSPDGKRLGTGSSTREAIKLWDVESHQQLLTLEGQGAEFHNSAFSPDGNVIGSMNTKGLLHIWRAPSWAEIEALEPRNRKFR